VVAAGKDTPTSSPRADRFIFVLDHLLMVSLPGHPKVPQSCHSQN
jgi:hypothetical protein